MKYTTESFIKLAEEVHKENENLSFSDCVYLGYNKVVEVTCKIHGKYFATPELILKGCNCKRCMEIRNGKKKSLGLDKFILKCKDRYGDYYDYSKVEYINMKKKVIVTCSIHGDFYISPEKFISGQECKLCKKNKTGKKSVGWSKSNYIKLCDDKYGGKSNLYLLKCMSNISNDVFYKVGITVSNIGRRYDCKKALPYTYECLYCIKLPANVAWETERSILRKLKGFKFKPDTEFSGVTECLNIHSSPELREIFESLLPKRKSNNVRDLVDKIYNRRDYGATISRD